MKTKAQVLVAFGKPLEEQEFDLLPLGDGEILVKLLASGVCGSDLHMASGEDPRTPLPIILGHEGLGEVVEIRGTKSDLDGEPLAVGDRILWNRGVVCGTCYWCTTAGQPWLCPERFVYGIHRSTEVPPHVNGCYAELMPLDARTDIIKMNHVADEDLRHYVSAGCSGATAANAFEDMPPREGDTVVVQGAGPLGSFITAFARKFGARQIVSFDMSPERLALAREFGATETVNVAETAPEERRELVRGLTGGRGADAVYEAVGQAGVFAEGLGLVRYGGRVVTAGFGQPGGTMEFDPFKHLTRLNAKLFGTWVSHTKHTRMAIDLVTANFETFKKLNTHCYPLSQANEAHAKMRTREALKAVLLGGQDDLG